MRRRLPTFCLIVATGTFWTNLSWSGESQSPNPQATTPAVSSGIRVSILENIPDKRSWDFTVDSATETFVEPTFAWPCVPRKYSSKGIVSDRPLPLLLRGEATFALPAGEYRFLLRALSAARFYVDDKLLLETKYRKPNGSGHESVPALASDKDPNLRPLPPGHEGALAKLTLDNRPHRFRLEFVYGDQKLRAETGELAVAVSRADEPFHLLAAEPTVPLTNEGWQTYIADARVRNATREMVTRRHNGAGEETYWARRHEIARQEWQQVHPRTDGAKNPVTIDNLIAEHLTKHQVTAASIVDDLTFLRRLTLDLIGVIPAPDEIQAYLQDTTTERRGKAIDRLLQDPRWADAWVGYWQDLLAEYPGILKPELNNSGPFRFWIYESLVDNKPLDRFATELVLMEGSVYDGGPAGFGVASQNDAPFAEKAHVLVKAFLGVELQCARCHDAPYHPFKQTDTFQLAAMLGKGPQTLPKTSTVPSQPGGRTPRVTLSLKPGDKIQPRWPLTDIAPAELPAGILRDEQNSRERLAAIITSPRNERFAHVLANRVWKRFIGWGLVPSVDDWNDARPALPELLNHLAGELVTHNYDLKHIVRTVVTSDYYQRCVQEPVLAASANQERIYPSPARRRLSAEQVVDSLFAAVDKSFRCEELTFDPEARQKVSTMMNLGVPRRAWQFTSLSNERDRPALSLPIAQSINDLLSTFGWREARANPIGERDDSPNVLQPLILANGIASTRVVTLSDDNAVTKLCLEERTPDELVQAVVLRVLSRNATDAERQRLSDILKPGFGERIVANSQPSPAAAANAPRTSVSWSNHLSPEATKLKLDLEKAARAGDPPTARLQPEWRERMEDVLWALVNSPEFVFLP